MATRTLLTSAALVIALALPAAAQTANPLKKPAPAAATTAPTPAPAAKAPPTTPAAPAAPAAGEAKKEPSEAQKAQQAKMKSCASEWNAMKKAGKTKGMTYREFSSDCLKKG